MLGFSADGGIFAFEEYGIQDGSGFAYANRYYIDTAKDAFVAGSPIRIQPKDEDPSVDDVRAEARKKGEAIVSDTELAKHMGYTAAINPVSELSADPYRIVANSSRLYPQPSDPMEFRLEELEGIKSGVECEESQEIRGFRLLKVDTHPGGATKVLHEDKQIPASRGCPLGYRISVVQSYFPDGGPHIAVVISRCAPSASKVRTIAGSPLHHGRRLRERVVAPVIVEAGAPNTGLAARLGWHFPHGGWRRWARCSGPSQWQQARRSTC